MSFADNLRRIRKERGLSQEALAEIMDVSRQAVSKWEQGEGYPEVEKLLLLSSALNVSLDSLMATEIAAPTGPRGGAAGSITITSPHEHVVATCHKVMSSQRMKGGKRSPKYALFGVSVGGAASSFWGEPTTFLGWYVDETAIAKEIAQIQQAMVRGAAVYELEYSAKVEKKWLRVSMVEE